jgi:acyl dehydratase
MRVSIHTDPNVAQDRGQPDAIVQGLCSATYISELCTTFFGARWLTTGHLSTAFIHPVIVRDTLTAYALVKGWEGDGDRKRLRLDVWCKNQRGTVVTVGHASAEVE